MLPTSLESLILTYFQTKYKHLFHPQILQKHILLNFLRICSIFFTEQLEMLALLKFRKTIIRFMNY